MKRIASRIARLERTLLPEPFVMSPTLMAAIEVLRQTIADDPERWPELDEIRASLTAEQSGAVA